MLGALFQWRIAVGLACVPALLCFTILLTMAPETPAWLMSKGREIEAKQALNTLRGKFNLEIVNSELDSIKQNMLLAQQNIDSTNGCTMDLIKKYLAILTDSKFLKPFGVLLLLFPYALNWTGIDAVQFYFVSIIR